MEAKLVVVGSKKAGMEIPISAPHFLIGSEEGCHFRVVSRRISPRHCVVSVDQQSVAVEDCGSDDGTFVNGERIVVRGRRELSHGDRIAVGPLQLEIRLDSDGNLSAARAKGSDGDDAEVAILHWLEEGEEMEIVDEERYWRRAAARAAELAAMGDGNLLDGDEATRLGAGDPGFGGASGGDAFGAAILLDEAAKKRKAKKKGWATKMGSIVAALFGPIYGRFQQLDRFERLLLATILILAMVVVMVVFPVTFTWFKVIINVRGWSHWVWTTLLVIVLGYLFWLREQYD